MMGKTAPIYLLDKGWKRAFSDILKTHRDDLLIVSPFIKEPAVEWLLNQTPTNIRVITRFSLRDFAGESSDITALRRLLSHKAKIRGVKNLHAKLYIFGSNRSVITSSNLTEGGVTRNHELGVVIKNPIDVAKCRKYFEDLWDKSKPNLKASQLNRWEKIVERHRKLQSTDGTEGELEDFGADISIPEPLGNTATRAFVKFLGSSKNRIPLSFDTVQEISLAGCHWAVCYPATKRPRQVSDGDRIFIARLTENPNDIRIFGRAIGRAYQEVRDDATPPEIKRMPWKKQWTRYIRVHDSEFIAGTMENAVSLNELMDNLQHEAFSTTQRNAAKGEGNINPRKAYSSMPAVELSPEGFQWVNERLDLAFETFGKVSNSDLPRPPRPGTSG